MQNDRGLSSDILTSVEHDVATARRNLNIDDNQFNRRTFIRTVFAAVEGIIFDFKQDSLERLKSYPQLYSQPEIAMLREESYALDNKGEAYSQPKFLRTSENFLFTMKMYMRDNYVPLEIDIDGVGWNAFKQSLSVRHRATHPKLAADFYITDKEIADAETAWAWFYQTLLLNLTHIGTAQKSKIVRLETELAQREAQRQQREEEAEQTRTSGDKADVPSIPSQEVE